MSQILISRRELLQCSGTMLSAAAVGTGVSLEAVLSSFRAVAAAESGGGLPADVRLGELKTLNGYFPFQPLASPAAWMERKAQLRRQILVATGLWPMPPRPQVAATVHGRVERDGYTVDRVILEGSPGFLVTGSLYRPAERSGALPTILSPHGHWPGGRFHDHGESQIASEIESGGEQFTVGGRHPLQARCVQLARMGCMVFQYDMLGYADGGSISYELAHRFDTQRDKLTSPEQWGLYSAQAELRLINVLGLHTWNSLRALDWLCSRDDCDTSRIGVTGASGGGTQTFLLTALDDRVTAAFPAVMVSTAMQGGCTCENASYLRVNTGNVEFAAMAAPRPLAMTGANDWTVDIETKGLPELRTHYAMLGAPDHVDARHFSFPHNYNHPSRMMMYRFFNRFLNLGFQESEIAERDFVPLTREEATVFNDQHPAPSRDEAAETAFLRSWDATSRAQLAEFAPTGAAQLRKFREVVGGALEVMIGRSLPDRDTIASETLTETDRGVFREYTARLKSAKYGEDIPAAFLYPHVWNHQVVLWIDGAGKAGMFDAQGGPIPPISALLKAGFAVGSVDLLYTGDYLADGTPLKQTRTVDTPRQFSGFTLGYNHPLFSQRTHDILSLLAFAAWHADQPRAIHLVGVGGAAAMCTAAAALAGSVVKSLAVETRGFRFSAITDIRDVNLLPGAVKYGDLPAFLAACVPVRLAVAGETPAAIATAELSYRTAGAEIRHVSDVSGLVNWLMEGV